MDCSLGNVTIVPAPSSTPSADCGVRMNGLKLMVWPQLVDGLTEEVGNFSIRLTDPSCDPEDSCEEARDEVGTIL